MHRGQLGGALDMDASRSTEAEEKMRELEAAALKSLHSKELMVYNRDGTCTCPFRSSERKTHLYKHLEFCSHAENLMKDRETGDQHNALLTSLERELMRHLEDAAPRIFKLLRDELRQRAEIMAPRVLTVVQPAPKRVRPEHRVVHPWAGIVHNVNTLERNMRRMLPENLKLRDQFAHFQPQCVKTFWEYEGVQGVSVLVFGQDMKAYANGRSFEESFQAVQRGRTDWERCTAARQKMTDLFGWMAQEDDYYEPGQAGQFLREMHKLTTMHDVVEEQTKDRQGLVKKSEVAELVDPLKKGLPKPSRAKTEKFSLGNKGVQAWEKAKVTTHFQKQLPEEETRQVRFETIKAAPLRVPANRDLKVVYPWVGLIYNAPTLDPDGRRTSPGRGGVREQFEEFDPQQVQVFWAVDGPMGVAAITFKPGAKGYEDCRLFNRSFVRKHQGRQNWLENKGTYRQGRDLYGWMAGEEDYNDEGRVGEFLRKSYHSITLNQLVDKEMMSGDLLEKQLLEIIQEQIRQLPERAHTNKKADQGLQLQVQGNETLRADSKRETRKRAQELDAQLASLVARYWKMSTNDTQNEGERRQLELKIPENEILLQMVAQEWTRVRDRVRKKHLSPIEKFENELKRYLEKEIHDQQ